VVSHDRYFLNRVSTDILAFEGNERIVHSVGDYEYYIEKRRRVPGPSMAVKEEKPAPQKSAPAKPRKLTYKETRELEGMEAQILGVEQEIARIEDLFSSPEFHRNHAAQTPQLKADLAAAKARLAELFARWETLEALRLVGQTPAR
jgi:ATP-binding cassette subfamily F protein uup